MWTKPCHFTVKTYHTSQKSILTENPVYNQIMQNQKCTYLSLEALAVEIGLPKLYLKQLAVKGSIPCLNVNGRLRFDAVSVSKALNELAGNGNIGSNDEHKSD